MANVCLEVKAVHKFRCAAKVAALLWKLFVIWVSVIVLKISFAFRKLSWRIESVSDRIYEGVEEWNA